jgi:branched-chain amino acid transport system substrate-binding protein
MFRRFLPLALASAFAVAGAPLHPVRAADTILIGAPISMTGEFARQGQLTLEAYELWENYVNSHGGLKVGGKTYTVSLRTYDDASKPQKAAAVADRLIEQDKVNFLLGPFNATLNYYVAGQADKYHVPMVTANGSAEKIYNQGYKYVFGVMSPSKKFAYGVIEMACRRTPRPDRLAVTGPDDARGLEIIRSAIESANDHGIHVIYRKPHASSMSVIPSVVAEIKSAKPDMIFNAGRLEDGVVFVKEMKAQGLSPYLYANSLGPDTSEWVKLLGKDADYTYGTTQWSPAAGYLGDPGFYRTSHEYEAAFERAYGHAASYTGAGSSAAALALQRAIENAGSLDRDKVREALQKLNIMTYYGPIRFDHRGINLWKPMVVVQIQNGKTMSVYPYRIGNAKPEYPAPAWSSR